MGYCRWKKWWLNRNGIPLIVLSVSIFESVWPYFERSICTPHKYRNGIPLYYLSKARRIMLLLLIYNVDSVLNR